MLTQGIVLAALHVADVPDGLVTVLNQQGTRAIRCGFIGGNHAIKRQLVAPTVHNHQRQAEFFQQGKLIVGDNLGGEKNDASSLVLFQLCNVFSASNGVGEVQRYHRRRQPKSASSSFDAGIDTCLKGAFVDDVAVDARNRKNDARNLSRAAVPKARNGLQNDVGCLGSDVAFFVEDIRDGCRRVACFSSYIADAYPCHGVPLKRQINNSTNTLKTFYLQVLHKTNTSTI